MVTLLRQGYQTVDNWAEEGQPTLTMRPLWDVHEITTKPVMPVQGVTHGTFQARKMQERPFGLPRLQASQGQWYEGSALGADLAGTKGQVDGEGTEG